MLTTEEESAFRESISRVRRAAAASLGRAHDAGQAIAFVAHLHRSLDDAVARAGALGPLPECRIGCSYCCSARVEATEPEIFLIARSVRKLPASQVSRIVEKLRHHTDKQRASDGQARQSCAFLEEGQCSIYDVRPGVCRKAHSLSAKLCADNSPEIPQNLKLLLDAEALMAGTSEAYREVKLPVSAHELNAAVLAALTDVSSEARWYRNDSTS
jgi:Fe-S-cluster containining protein